MEERVKDILLEQLELLAQANKNCEPELIASNVLAMLEIAKLFNLYRDLQECYRLT